MCDVELPRVDPTARGTLVTVSSTAIGRAPNTRVWRRVRATIGVLAGLLAPSACHSAPPLASRAEAKPLLMPHPSNPAPGEPLDIAFSGFSGSSQDWISIVPKDAPAEQHGERILTDGQTSGQRSFQGLAPGAYEARAYFDGPSGAYSVEARATIEVRGEPVHGAPSLATTDTVYSAYDDIQVTFASFSGAEHDWITIAPAGSPHAPYGERRYTSGARDGVLQFHGLAPGDYEVRGYFDWPAGGYATRAVQGFRVNAAPAADPALPPEISRSLTDQPTQHLSDEFRRLVSARTP